MSYPEIVQYNEAVQHPQTAFADPELRQGNVMCTPLGLPLALSGGFALTYTMMGARRKLAVRCFRREIPSVQQKYAAIAKSIKALRSPYFVDFEYLEDGIRIGRSSYPVVKMDWADGDPLGVWIARNCEDRRAIKRLRVAFAALAEFLEEKGIAHGDIQNGNVIISNRHLKLVDYDGIYVRGMPVEFGCETGHAHFQHPGRTTAHFGPAIDRFSFIVVDLSLAALLEDPSLYRRLGQDGETIIFRGSDFADPESSGIFQILDRFRSLREPARRLAAICRADVAMVPTLADFRAGRNIPVAAAKPVSRPASADDSNRRLLEQLLGNRVQPLSRSSAAVAPPARHSAAARQNQDVLKALRHRVQRSRASAASAAAAPPARPAPAVSRAAPPGRVIPPAGSVVIHPRTSPAIPRPMPVAARPAPSAGVEAEHGMVDRVLQFFGIKR